MTAVRKSNYTLYFYVTGWLQQIYWQMLPLECPCQCSLQYRRYTSTVRRGL